MKRRNFVALAGHDGSRRDCRVAQTDKVMIMIVTDNIAKESRLHADERCFYFGAGQHLAAHKTISSPTGEYVRGNVHQDLKKVLELDHDSKGSRNLPLTPQGY